MVYYGKWNSNLHDKRNRLENKIQSTLKNKFFFLYMSVFMFLYFYFYI